MTDDDLDRTRFLETATALGELATHMVESSGPDLLPCVEHALAVVREIEAELLRLRWRIVEPA